MKNSYIMRRLSDQEFLPEYIEVDDVANFPYDIFHKAFSPEVYAAVDRYDASRYRDEETGRSQYVLSFVYDAGASSSHYVAQERQLVVYEVRGY